MDRPYLELLLACVCETSRPRLGYAAHAHLPQGLVNRQAPRLFLVQDRYDELWLEWLVERGNVQRGSPGSRRTRRWIAS